MQARHRALSPIKIAFAGLLSAALWAALLVGPQAVSAATANASAGSWVKIQTPVKMKAAKKLRYRIFCRDRCKLSVTTKLKWPNRPNLVTTIKGQFNAGESRANILTLNNPARNTLKANWRRTIMQVIVRARNLDTGAKRTAKKSVRFKR